jgi:hypothetical protein
VINTLFTNLGFLREPLLYHSGSLPARRRSNSSVSSLVDGELINRSESELDPPTVTISTTHPNSSGDDESNNSDTDYDDGVDSDTNVKDDADVDQTSAGTQPEVSERGAAQPAADMAIRRQPAAGDTVVLSGLTKRPDLNGTTATVELESKWKEGRVAVRLANNPFRPLSVDPSKLTVISTATEDGAGWALPTDPLLQFDNYEEDLAEDTREARILADRESAEAIKPATLTSNDAAAVTAPDAPDLDPVTSVVPNVVAPGLQWNLSKLRDSDDA